MKNKVSVYLASQMTGRTGEDLWRSLLSVKPIYEKYGIELISPIEKEGIAPDKHKLADRSDTEMMHIWKEKDKAQIRDVNVFAYIASAQTSQGVMKEYAYARGTLWKPTLGIYLGLTPGFITRAEDDAVCTSHEEAALTIAVRWGSRWKRILWRVKMLNRALPKWLWNQIKEFK